MLSCFSDSLVLAGAGPRHGGDAPRSYARLPSGLGLLKTTVDLRGVGALVVCLILTFSTPVGAVTCPTCVDTIAGCTGSADCPLLKGPIENAAALAPGAAGKVLDVSKVLPTDMLCTFTRPVCA